MSKYLAGYAEVEVDYLSSWASHAYERVLVVPAYRESPAFLQRIPVAAGKSLVIVVINAPPVAIEDGLNEKLLEAISSAGQPLWASQNLALFTGAQAHYDVLRVDRHSSGLRTDGGVGVARKTGGDLACSLIERGSIRSPWIHNTDGDTQLPPDYFDASSSAANGASALLFPYEHDCDLDEPIGWATRLYELGLNHYVAGLKLAGSPYAFQTVGSSFAVHARAYAQVRGFPKREAGEDFYMLNKLAKVGAVVAASTAPIRIQARTSDRVPFGTGAGVAKILALADPINEYRFYHPGVFTALGEFLGQFDALWSKEDPSSSLAALRQHLDFAKGLSHARSQSRSQKAYLGHLHNWFDGFRTLKAVHWLRDQRWPSLTLAELCQHADYPAICKRDEGMSVQAELLLTVRATRPQTHQDD